VVTLPFPVSLFRKEGLREFLALKEDFPHHSRPSICQYLIIINGMAIMDLGTLQRALYVLI
jgi:hypothetical protein